MGTISKPSMLPATLRTPSPLRDAELGPQFTRPTPMETSTEVTPPCLRSTGPRRTEARSPLRQVSESGHLTPVKHTSFPPPCPPLTTSRISALLTLPLPLRRPMRPKLAKKANLVLTPCSRPPPPPSLPSSSCELIEKMVHEFPRTFY